MYNYCVIYSMKENSKRINVAIPIDLYNQVIESKYGLTEAIIKGLELLMQPKDNRFNELSDQLNKLTDVLHMQASYMQGIQLQSPAVEAIRDWKSPAEKAMQGIQGESAAMKAINSLAKGNVRQNEASLKPLQKEETKSKDKPIKKPAKIKHEPSHKAHTPIHVHTQNLHSEHIPETITEKEKQVCENDFFGNECDTVVKTEEEPIKDISNKGKKKTFPKDCEVCGKIFPAQTKRALVCSPKCRKAKSRINAKEKAKEV